MLPYFAYEKHLQGDDNAPVAQLVQPCEETLEHDTWCATDSARASI